MSVVPVISSSRLFPEKKERIVKNSQTVCPQEDAVAVGCLVRMCGAVRPRQREEMNVDISTGEKRNRGGHVECVNVGKEATTKNVHIHVCPGALIHTFIHTQ